MMHTLTYTSNRAGTVIDLADPEGIMCGQITELRTRTWEFELGYRSLQATRPAKTVKVTGLVYGIPALEKAEELFDADMYAYLNDAAKPGVITVDGWSQTCLVVGHEPDYTSPLLVRGDFTVALLDGVWHKPVRQSFSRSTARYSRGKDYPYDYRYDYAPTRNVSSIDNQSALPSRMRLTIYGPVSTPSIIIGGNKVIADVSVPSGGYLIIDGTGSPRTAVMVAANGDITNVFDKTHRDQASNEYAFATLPPGLQQVSWDESFGFDVEYWLEQTGLPWT